MSAYDDVAQDLAHIRTMILALEHLGHDDDVGRPTPVTSPDYWRARINAIYAADLPPSFRQQASALLERLDALRASRTGSPHDRPPASVAGEMRHPSKPGRPARLP
jgi:hypothetical protein